MCPCNHVSSLKSSSVHLEPFLPLNLFKQRAKRERERERERAKFKVRLLVSEQMLSRGLLVARVDE